VTFKGNDSNSNDFFIWSGGSKHLHSANSIENFNQSDDDEKDGDENTICYFVMPRYGTSL